VAPVADAERVSRSGGSDVGPLRRGIKLSELIQRLQRQRAEGFDPELRWGDKEVVADALVSHSSGHLTIMTVAIDPADDGPPDEVEAT
jgi:hypothetical protein